MQFDVVSHTHHTWSHFSLAPLTHKTPTSLSTLSISLILTFTFSYREERKERKGKERREVEEKEEEGEGKEGRRRATSPWLEDVAGTMLHLIHDVKFAEVGGEGHPEHLLQP